MNNVVLKHKKDLHKKLHTIMEIDGEFEAI